MAAPRRPGGWAGTRTAGSAAAIQDTEGSIEDVLGEALGIDIRETSNTRVAFRPWSVKIHEPKTGQLDFSRFPFQEALYADEFAYADDGSVMKATQVGVSTWLIRWTIFFPDTKGWTALYVFPKDKHLRAFSDQRVKPLIERNAYLRSRVPYGYVSNKGLKQVGNGFVNYRGSQNKDELDSIDCDLVGFDEYDRLVQENIPDAEQRVGASPHGLIRRIGVPTIPRRGISALYDASDRRKWLVKCSRCPVGWQEIDFWKNVDQEATPPRIVCSGCRKPLDVAKGKWVAEITEGNRHPGFHISRLLVPGAKLDKVVEHSKQRKTFQITRFFTKDLGLPYASEEGSLDEATIEAAQTAGGGYEMPQGHKGTNPVTAGIDMASVRDATVRISEHIDEDTKRALFIGEIGGKNLREFLKNLGDLMRRYHVNMAAIDHLPDGRVARAFASMFPGLVYVVALAGKNQKQIFMVDEQLLTASVKRTESLDAMIAMIREQNNHLPATLPENYVEQMMAPQRFEEEDEETGEIDIGYISAGPDDYAMAEVFDMIATELWWIRVGVASQFQQRTTTLDEELGPDYQRSRVNEYDDSEDENTYGPGPTRDAPSDEDEDWKIRYGDDEGEEGEGPLSWE